MDVSRFIYIPEFVVGGVVGKEAFLPSLKKRPLETSVSFHPGCSIDWKSAFKIGAKRHPPQDLVGSAECDQSDVAIAMGLYYDDDGKGPYPKHANILGWDEVAEIRRYEQAEALARDAVFEPPPTFPSGEETGRVGGLQNQVDNAGMLVMGLVGSMGVSS